jgi:D-xylose 1-dehydrogenase (NADP+, D-xylono-1,5-lactone-forming)
MTAAATTAWGLLSTARINDRLLAGAARSDRVAFAAVASRDRARAEAYASEHGLARAYGSYDELLTDDQLDAVYISLPNHLHVEWAIRALQAGKHVLCEKPLSRSARDVARAVDVAARAGRLLTEGFMWRHHPQTRTVQRLLSEGVIGRVVEVRAALVFDLEAERGGAQGDSRLRVDHDGGALTDVGAYCVSAIRAFAGEPVRVTAMQELGPTGVDLRTTGVLECAGGAVGRFECSFVETRRDELEIVGERGSLRVSTPFLCKRPGIEIHRGMEVEAIAVPVVDSYQLELEDLHDAIVGASEPLLGAGDALGQATALEALTRAAALGQPVVPGTSADMEVAHG